MKKAVIVIVIISLIVFVSSLAGGIYLAARTIGWSDLLDSTKISYHINNLVRDVRFLDNFHGPLNSYTIDELRTSDLQGIEVISISGLAEDITITTEGTEISAELSGSYRSRGRKINWIMEQTGSELKIKADYPVFGLFSSDLDIDIAIPASFEGEVRVNTLSGTCLLPDNTAYSWQSFVYDGLSGKLEIESTSMENITFNSLSGNIVLNQTDAAIKGETMSGKITVNMEEVKQTDLETLSGNIELFMPASSACRIEFSTLSGDFRNNGLEMNYLEQDSKSTTAVMNEGDVLILIETMSGNLIMASR